MPLRFGRHGAAEQKLHIVPRLLGRAIVPGRVIAPLVQVEPADIDGGAVKDRDLLVMRPGKEARDRPATGRKLPSARRTIRRVTPGISRCTASSSTGVSGSASPRSGAAAP